MAKAKAGKLRNQCKGFIKKIYAKSSCGLAATANGAKVPCVKKLVSNNKTTCAVKPSGACTSKAGVYTQSLCSDAYTCLDAGDTNNTLSLDAGDTGACAGQLGPIVGTLNSIVSAVKSALEQTPPGRIAQRAEHQIGRELHRLFITHGL